jgi:uncharacterized membrane protein YeaQ/YmgE (transglycosylase-associated protein family)
MMNILFGFVGLASLLSYGALAGAFVLDLLNFGPEKQRKAVLLKCVVASAVSLVVLLTMKAMGYSNGLLQYLPEWVQSLP